MSKIKYVIFDLDGVLAPIGKPVSDKTRKELKKIEKNANIVIASGKNLDYLMGFSRYLGIHPIALIGENGATIFFYSGSKELNFLKNSTIEKIKKDVYEKYNGIWSPNNKIQFSIYGGNETLNEIYSYIKRKYGKYVDKSIKLIIYADALDILPKNISKGRALKYLKKYLNIKSDEIISIGDSEMDLTMAKESKYFIYINGKKERLKNIIYIENVKGLFSEIDKLMEGD